MIFQTVREHHAKGRRAAPHLAGATTIGQHTRGTRGTDVGFQKLVGFSEMPELAMTLSMTCRVIWAKFSLQAAFRNVAAS